MIQLSPVDQEFPRLIKGMQARLDALERSRQPYLGDWNEFNKGDFAYVSNNVISVSSGIPVDDFFQIGDKVWITQTTEKYFYILAVDIVNNRLTLTGGDDYTFTNATFTGVATSRSTNPSGHPIVFNFDTGFQIWSITTAPAYVNRTTSFGGGSGQRSCQFMMNGNVATIWFAAGTTAWAASQQAAVYMSPFLVRSEAGQDVRSTSHLISGTYGGGADIHVQTTWGDMSGAVSGRLGLDIRPYTLLDVFDTGAFGFDTVVTVPV